MLIVVKEKYFENREFSFTLAGDIYVRYQSFKDDKDFKNALLSKIPEKIDIGAVFSGNPRDHKKGLIIATADERELVFDIDMTDYDDVRTCCTGAGLCKKCWPFLAIAAKVIDQALRDDFGYQHLLWIYSGRRGIHCWIADEGARKLDKMQRASLASYLTVIEGGKQKDKKVLFDGRSELHSSITKALKIIDPYFEKLIISDQNLLPDLTAVKKFIKLCPNQMAQNHLFNHMGSYNPKDGPHSLWKGLKYAADQFFALKDKKSTTGRHFIKEIKLQFCYPRLDVEVSKGVNHLLKAPFCVHPKTGRICIPINLKDIDKFDPTKVPTVKELVEELAESSEKAEVAVKHSKLGPSLALFEGFVLNLPEVKHAKEIKLSKIDAISAMEF